MLRSVVAGAGALVVLVAAAVAAVPSLVPSRLPPPLRKDAEEVAHAQAIAPNDPCVLYEVASLYAQAGDNTNALAALRAMAATGAGLDPRAGEFGTLLDSAEAKAIVAEIRTRNPPVLRARVAFTVASDALLPEGVAWSARTKKLYLGGPRQIGAVDEHGKLETFAHDAGFASLLGLRVDDPRGELWAVARAPGHAQPGASGGLFRFRLADGALVRAYPLADDGKHALNDLVVASDGTVYASATNSGTVVRLDPKSGRFDDFVPPGTVPDANGITLSPDGRYLFVASWYNITRIEIATRAAVVLRKPDAIADGCNDGLYFYGARSLIGVQNCVHATGRVMRYELGPDLTSIARAEVLESYNPKFAPPTTGAIAGDTLLVVANPQIRKIGPDGRLKAPLDPFVVLRVPLAPAR
jgi:sugar lactone lactonase YvrE